MTTATPTVPTPAVHAAPNAGTDARDAGPTLDITLDIPTDDGRMPTFVAAPAGPGPHPLVVFYMDALGIRDELYGMARRIARRGYVCALPDLYYRSGLIRLDFARGLPAVLPVARAAMGQLTTDMVVRDTGALLQALAAQPQVRAGAVGAVGHCMSGRYVVACMARYPDRMRAGASLYGTGLVTEEPDSPHRLLGAVRGELYFAFGGQDAVVPESVRTELAAAVAASGVAQRTEVFAQAGHGFAFAERVAYDAAAAETTWQRIFDLLERQL